MAIKKLNQNPRITDTILIDIATPGADGCFDSNPYKVDNLTIYYIDRSFFGENYGEYNKKLISDELQKKLEKAEKTLCDNPNEDNIKKLEILKQEIESSSNINKIYFKERTPVKVVGTKNFPAWIGTDIENSSLVLQSEDSEGEVQYGRFTYEWNGQGSIREGDYFACWTWTPLPAGEKLSSHVHFRIEGDGRAVSTTPAHVTVEGKYETLLERYLPEVYKYTLSNQDITPNTLEKFNLSIAKGFTFLEDMANQIIDLFDANALHESMLKYLSNTFSLKLRSSDPTLWRRQIKESVPLFKKKGSIEGLRNAFEQSGMRLNGHTQYWQLVSPYTWVQVFKVEDSPNFKLEKNIILPLNENYFELFIKRHTHTESLPVSVSNKNYIDVYEEDYVKISSDNVVFETDEDGATIMKWVGDMLSAGNMDLYEGDKIKVKYQYKEFDAVISTSMMSSSSYSGQVLENYIQSLPLSDQRDEDAQEYPLKNWNVRLIAEDDPLFDTLIPIKHPFADPIQFGWVRTEFAYSENIYNAEEYNGSTRPSFDACNIDKNFIDPCGACLSSSCSFDIGIEELSNERLIESKDILREFLPFHTRVHSINFTGEWNEFIQSPVEHIETLVTIDKVQHVLSGNKNPFFNRTMDGGLSNWVVTRENLTDQITAVSGKTGTAYNDHVVIISPDHDLGNLGILWNNHVLEVLSPSLNSGRYVIDKIQGSTARVNATVVEPLDKSAFTFNLYNIIYKSTTTSIFQDNLIKLDDINTDFDFKDLKTLWDLNQNPSIDPWYVKIPAYSSNKYFIEQIQEKTLILQGDNDLPNSNIDNLEFYIFNHLDEEIYNSSSGVLTVRHRGRVNFNDSVISNLKEFIKFGDLLYYDGNGYPISSIRSASEFYIDNYNSGDAISVSVENRRFLIKEGIGYFGYKGLKLSTPADHEAEFDMINGENHGPIDSYTDNNNFKENYLFKIGEEFYKIASIDGKSVTLEGREQDWGTLSFGGSSVGYSIVHFPKKKVNVGFIVFDQLGRDGKDPIVREIYDDIDKNTAIVALSTPKGSGVQENVSQEEGLFLEIEMKNGEKFEGEI